MQVQSSIRASNTDPGATFVAVPGNPELEDQAGLVLAEPGDLVRLTNTGSIVVSSDLVGQQGGARKLGGGGRGRRVSAGQGGDTRVPGAQVSFTEKP